MNFPSLNLTNFDVLYTRNIVFSLVLSLFLTACSTSRVWNTPINTASMADDYVFYNRLPKHNAQDTFVVLAFSGGGTRSAAFSYGLLEKLRNTYISINGQSRRLIDEVDVISSVSGGSYTAAYYGLFGERIFQDYESAFLHRDVQGKMLHLLMNPMKLAKLTSKEYNRGDLAARWLDKHIFKGKTFNDMSRGDLPYVIINSSDINTGTTFSFIQQQFDFLCSNISDYPVANAVMASSAVPGVFTPIAVKNFDTSCVQKTTQWNNWVKDSLEHDSIYNRRFQVSRALSRYYQPSRLPKIRLVDGGVTDNLGVRGSIMSPIAHYGNVVEMKGAFTPAALNKVKRVLVIVANAQTYDDYKWSRQGKGPRIIDTLNASFSAAIGILNTETITLAKHSFNKWQRYINKNRSATMPKVKVYFSTLTFNQIKDTKRRSYFDTIPTTFNLSDEQVDAVRGLAGELLEQSPEFQAFKRSVE